MLVGILENSECEYLATITGRRNSYEMKIKIMPDVERALFLEAKRLWAICTTVDEISLAMSRCSQIQRLTVLCADRACCKYGEEYIWKTSGCSLREKKIKKIQRARVSARSL
jgi:hypothetical protein